MIVNVSGGGCPDVPYLAQELIGHRLEGCSQPPPVGAHPLRLCPGAGLSGDQTAMLAVVGTVPEQEVGVVSGQARLEKGLLLVEGRSFPVNRGNTGTFGRCPGRGRGGRRPGGLHLLGRRHRHGPRQPPSLRPSCQRPAGFAISRWMAFHYLQPDADGHGRVLMAVDQMSPRPLLVGDAGFMYAAKMCGQAPSYDLFTPDAGELAFLADHKAPHPFYTQGFILHQEGQVPAQIARAYAHGNAARHLLVKGKRDYLTRGPQNIEALDGPSHPALEAHRRHGRHPDRRGRRPDRQRHGGRPEPPRRRHWPTGWPASWSSPPPATQISEIIAQLPAALEKALATMQE